MSTTVRLRLSPGVRKVALVAHISAAGAWLGLDLALGILVVTALTADPAGAGAAATSISTFATWPLAALGVLTLITGIVLGLGSKYGLLRYWWVLVKLAINIVLVTLVLFVLTPGVETLGGLGRTTLADGTPLDASAALLFPPIVSSTAVLIAITLSVVKPWGRVVRRGQVDSMGGVTLDLEGTRR